MCMMELGELQKRHDEFARRHVRIYAISNEDRQEAQATQTDFPDLVIVSDVDQKLAKAMQVLHPGAGRNGDDTNAPITVLVDGTGQVRRLLRPARVFERPSPDEVLAAIDEAGPGK